MSTLLRRAVIAGAVALVPATAAVVLSWPAHASGSFPTAYAAPYLEVHSTDVGDLATDQGATGLKYYTLAFLIPSSGCTAKWEYDGDPVGAFNSQISSLKSAGGDVIISFGGASGGELAQTCTSVSGLTAAYKNVVDTYGVTRLDFDIEGSPLDDTASNSRRDQALAALQAADPAVQVDFTLPVDPTGLPGNAMALLNDAKSKGVKVNLVNIMTMDFGNGHNVLNDAESAANGTHGQLGTVWSGLSSAQEWAMIGLTTIAGQNDDTEVFSQSDASSLESFAASRGIQELAFWEVDSYDKATGWAYSKIFNKITSSPATDDFSVSASPTAGSVTVGGSTTTTLGTAVTAGSAQSVTLSTSGAPSGVTVSLNPATVTAGGSSTVTLSAASTAAVGTYPITLTGTAGSVSHSTTYTLTVNPVSGGNAIVNGGFETGDFTGWTRAGTTTIVTSGAHTGTHAVQLGSTAPTNGDSKVSQTFTAPGGATQLSFSYSITCPDDVAYDWATATLKDNTTGVTATPLARTCTNGAGWKPVTAPVTAGHSYTVTLVSHDENNPGDATYTLYDDVTVNGSASGNDFSIATNPTSGSAAQGASATTSVTTAVTSGSAQSVALSSSGAPAGVTVSFSPASVTAGGSATMTVAAASSAAAGTYPVTVIGTATSGSHTTLYTVTVTAPVTGGITNGGFETGDFTGWTRAGTSAIVTSGVHGGTHAVRLGSTAPTNGDSKVSQTFTAPGGVGTLTFFYSITCPDDVAYDWATVTVKDNTTGATVTPLGKTCTLNQGWKQGSTPVMAGHSYTVTLVSHDENNPGDATYTQYDDVALS